MLLEYQVWTEVLLLSLWEMQEESLEEWMENLKVLWEYSGLLVEKLELKCLWEDLEVVSCLLVA